MKLGKKEFLSDRGGAMSFMICVVLPLSSIHGDTAQKSHFPCRSLRFLSVTHLPQCRGLRLDKMMGVKHPVQ